MNLSDIENQELQDRLAFGLQVLTPTRELILKHFQNPDLEIILKGDESPVTVADKGAEELIRERLADTFPKDGILGEEHGTKESENGFRWILDPIDGTKSFISGVPLFGTLIGLEYEKECVLGICDFPGLNETVYAAKGGGTWWQRGSKTAKRTHVSQVDDLSKARFCVTSFTRWHDPRTVHAMNTLSTSVGLARGWGDCYGHILVATGRIDLMVDPNISPWHVGALVAILQEAGGHFLDWDGTCSIYTGHGFSSNEKLKDEVLGILAGE